MERSQPGLTGPSVGAKELDNIPEEFSPKADIKKVPSLPRLVLERQELRVQLAELSSGSEDTEIVLDDEIARPLSSSDRAESRLSLSELPRLSVSSDSEDGMPLENYSEAALDFPQVSTRNINLDLPPMYKLREIYQHIASNAIKHGFRKVIEKIAHRGLRVATVCSGTESPLLAMIMLKEGLSKIDVKFSFHHIFSCEIVPLKQAYIERNFAPAVMFRDVRELGAEIAKTAYGADKLVPRDVDVIIGGTACVDFSGLNNNKKTLDQRGESGATFQGMLDYSKRFRPRMIVLENVAAAPWDQFGEAWLIVGYVSSWVKVDSKDYYIPQTRVRGYMVCADQRRLQIAEYPDAINACVHFKSQFQVLVRLFRRQASSPASDFMLDQYSIEYEELMRAYMARSGVLNWNDICWTAYQKRHVMYRLEYKLGNGRPISRSRPGGFRSQFPDWFSAWLAGQPERVRETIDLKWLYFRKHGYVDIFYKEKFIDLSQGVDRSPDSCLFGSVGCLTPHGLPFLTSRASPIFGIEALALQGIPNTVLLSRETPKEIQDLAGNAMTSPTVAIITICAMIAAAQVFDDSPEERVLPPKLIEDPIIIVPYSIDSTHQLVSCKPDETQCFLDVDDGASLVEKAIAAAQLQNLILRASQSAQFCACERQLSFKQRVLQCAICGFSACTTCAGNPTHIYKPLRMRMPDRNSPHDFISFLKKVLSMKLRMSDLAHPGVVTDHDLLASTFTEQLIANNGLLHRKLNQLQLQQAIDIAQMAFSDEFCYRGIRRTKIWEVFYAGRYSELQLEIGYGKVQWALYAKTPDSIVGSDLLRVLFKLPIARMIPKSFIYTGEWQISTALSVGFHIKISGSGIAERSYEAECGLPESEGVSEKTWSEIIVEPSLRSTRHPECGYWGPYCNVVNDLDVDICGTYTRLPNCGMALASLYKMDLAVMKQEFTPPGSCDTKLSTQERIHAFEKKYPLSRSMDWVYLFFDPQKTGEPHADHFTFSFEHHPLVGHEQRKAIASLTGDFKPHHLSHKNVSGKKTFVGYFRRFKTCIDAKISPMVVAPEHQHKYATLPSNVQISVEASECKASYVPLLHLNFPGFEPEDAEYLDPAKNTRALEEWGLKWTMQKNSGMMRLSAWKDLDLKMILPTTGTICQSCDPLPPIMLWGRNAANLVTPYEDPQGAARFERAIKNRPPPFVVFIKKDVDFALNVQSMAHRAYGNLVNTGNNTDVRFQWRLLTDTYATGPKPHNTFIICNNSWDSMSNQPPGFLLDMRPEQLQSLTWMVSQEREDIEPFLEMEVEEARFIEVSWQAEVKVTMPRKIRGGLCADEVGYGKTVTILGLIDTQFDTDQKRMREEITDSHFIQSRATLIVVPSNVFKQWTEETAKFLGKKYKTLEIKNVQKLQSFRVSDIQEADIIFLSWAVLESERYYEAMQNFTASPQAPNNGRQFDHWFHESRLSLRELIYSLNVNGHESLIKDVEEKKNRLRRDQANSKYTPSVRLRGAKFTAAQRKDTFTESNPNRNQAKEEKKPLTSDEYRKKFNLGPNTASMKFPLLHSFHFNRIVVDEFTYAGEVRQLPLVELSGRSKWILSGTPSPCEFADIKSIARQLGVHLGIDNDNDMFTKNPRLKTIRKQMSAVEHFLMYKPTCSHQWYENRHEHAQKFLDQFARQNKANIESIPVMGQRDLTWMEVREKSLYGVLHRHFIDNDTLRNQEEDSLSHEILNEIGKRVRSAGSPIEALVQFGLTPCDSYLPSSSKLRDIVKIVKETPKEDQVIIFTQFIDLMESISSALTKEGIENRVAKATRLNSTTEFTGSSKGKSSPLVKVLILPLGNVMAAGLNLQCANHVIFVTPLCVSEIHEYESGMTQAIGRVRRYGQKKTVYCHFMLTAHTAEVNVFEEMTNSSVYVDPANSSAFLQEQGHQDLPAGKASIRGPSTESFIKFNFSADPDQDQ